MEFDRYRLFEAFHVMGFILESSTVPHFVFVVAKMVLLKKKKMVKVTNSSIMI